MTINIKNFLSDKTKLSKMGEFQSLKQISGLEMSSISADLYGDGRDDLALFYFSKGANYATLTTTNTITSEFIPWNNNSHKKIIKGLLVNTKNANTFTGKQGKESIDILAKNLARVLTIKESKSQRGTDETVKVKDLIFASTGVIGEEFPVEKIKNTLSNLVEKLRSDHNKMYWIKIASAIMTTDTKPKVAYEEVIVGDEWYGGNLSYHLRTNPIWFYFLDNRFKSVKTDGGFIFTQKKKLLTKEMCPGLYGSINNQAICMIGTK